MSRDPQIDNLADPSLKKMAEASRDEHKVDFGMTQLTGVRLDKFAELVRADLLASLEAEGRLLPQAKAGGPKP